MTQTYKKKLIEVAIPLEAINAASAWEKTRLGHLSTLHLWWVRRSCLRHRASPAQGAMYWTHQGKALRDLRDELESE